MDHQPPTRVTTSLFPEVSRPGNRQDDEFVPRVLPKQKHHRV